MLGQIDVFLTSELATNLSVVAETVLESPEDTGSQIAEVERFQLQYSPWDALSVSVGRMHTMLGFWNQAYHHGAWLQTTAFRPEVYRWEDDDGGLLPVHEVGVRLAGAATIRPLRFEYAASVVNGRAADPSRVATFQDENGAKAVHLWAGLSPRALPHLQVGGTAVFDTIPPDPATSSRGAPRRAHLGRLRRLPGATAGAARGGVLGRPSRRHDGQRVDQRAVSTRRRHGRSGAGSLTTASTAWIATRATPTTRRRCRTSTSTPRACASTAWSRVALKLEASRARVAGGSPFNAAAVQAAFTF